MDNSKQIDILLVEDNPNDVELTIRGFSKYNFGNNIKIVRDGEEALEFIFANGRYEERHIEDKPSLILLDLNLPKVDGLEVLRVVKSDPRTKSIPVVILTTSRKESDKVASYDLGTNSYIVKPVDFGKFTEVARQLGYYWLLLNEKP